MYPTTAPEIALPELDGKTAKMYRGGKICLTDHFKPLWARNVPKFGIAHAMALGVSCFFIFILLTNLVLCTV
jgi:ufm1-conjugating enzyme 1